MSYCTNCGEEITEDQRYCSYCGEQLGDDPSGRRRRRGERPEATKPSARRGEPEQTDELRHEDVGAAQRPGSAEIPREGTEPDEPVTAGIPRQGAAKSYLSGFKKIFRQPVALGGLFVAWFGISVLVLFGAGTAFAVFLGSSVAGLVAAGLLYVGTEADLNDESTTTAKAFGAVQEQFVSLLIIWILYVPAVIVGLFLFILPGLYVGGRLLLAFPATVLDREGPLDSLSTSWSLTSGVSLKALGLLILTGFAFFALVIVLSIPQAITFSLIGIELPEIDPTTDSFEELFAAVDTAYIVGSAIFQAIALAIAVGALQIAAARMYLEERYGGESEWRYY